MMHFATFLGRKASTLRKSYSFYNIHFKRVKKYFFNAKMLEFYSII